MKSRFKICCHILPYHTRSKKQKTVRRIITTKLFRENKSSIQRKTCLCCFQKINVGVSLVIWSDIGVILQESANLPTQSVSTAFLSCDSGYKVSTHLGQTIKPSSCRDGQQQIASSLFCYYYLLLLPEEIKICREPTQ